MLILVDATFAWSVGADFPVIIRYRLSHQGIVAMVHPDGFLTVHIPLLVGFRVGASPPIQQTLHLSIQEPGFGWGESWETESLLNR